VTATVSIADEGVTVRADALERCGAGGGVAIFLRDTPVRARLRPVERRGDRADHSLKGRDEGKPRR